MKKGRSAFSLLFALIMFICVLFLVWYLPAVQDLQFRVNDVQKSLETSQGRERKQQHEYDETVAALPEVNAELDRLLPLCEAAEEEVRALKDERSRLREELAALQENSAAPAAGNGGSDHE